MITQKPPWDEVKTVVRRKFIAAKFTSKMSKTSNKQFNLISKVTRKEEQRNPKLAGGKK